MIPRGLGEEHFRLAGERIDDNGVPKGRRSTRYDVVIGGKPYPPKYAISLASLIATGIEHPAVAFTAVEAKNYFLGRTYEVIDKGASPPPKVVPENDESAFPEGEARYRLHRTRERDGGITRRAKSKRLKEQGRLECDVCSLDFRDVYGRIGEGFIEAHHTVPVASLSGNEKTKLADIALVCSNCHRMLHRGMKLLSVRELRQVVRRGRANLDSLLS